MKKLINMAFSHHRLLTVAVTLITALALLSKVPEYPPLKVNMLDKWTHLLLFLIVGCAYINTATDGFKIVNGSRFFLSFVAASAYGVLLEGIQHFVPWRSSDWIDMATNTAGAAVAMILCLKFREAIRSVRFS